MRCLGLTLCCSGVRPKSGASGGASAAAAAGGAGRAQKEEAVHMEPKGGCCRLQQVGAAAKRWVLRAAERTAMLLTGGWQLWQAGIQSSCRQLRAAGQPECCLLLRLRQKRGSVDLRTACGPPAVCCSVRRCYFQPAAQAARPGLLQPALLARPCPCCRRSASETRARPAGGAAM